MIIFKPVKKKKINRTNMSHHLSLSELETTVKKVNAIVDVPVTDFNGDFMIDNFQPKNILRSSMLRTEFNILCKGKTESKNLAPVKYENETKIYLCKEDQIRDIPPLLQPIFDRPSKYYILGTPSNSSFFYALLSMIEPNFILEGSVQKEERIDSLRDDLVFKMEEYYIQNNYKAKRFKKSVIRDNILNKKIFLPAVIHYILDYHNICLLIIDTETYLYTLGNDYSEERDYLIMLRKNNYFQPILNSEGNSKFTYEILDKISSILKPEFEIEKSKSTLSVSASKTQTLTPKTSAAPSEIKLEKESKYKLPELQALAQKLDIAVKKSGTQRNKKKSDLYQEIKEKLGC